jgi:hypothetical protein
MLKTINIALICAVLGAASWTYKIKHDAGLIEDELAKVERQIDLEKETIVLLEADWSLLDQPERLQRIAEAYKDALKLEPPRPDQVVDLDGLPAPPPPPEASEEGEDGEKPEADAVAQRIAQAERAAR